MICQLIGKLIQTIIGTVHSGCLLSGGLPPPFRSNFKRRCRGPMNAMLLTEHNNKSLT